MPAVLKFIMLSAAVSLLLRVPSSMYLLREVRSSSDTAVDHVLVASFLTLAAIAMATAAIWAILARPRAGYVILAFYPIAGILLGAAAASGCDGFLCEAGGAGIGLLLGMGGAIAIDAAVFAYDDPRPRRADARRLVPLFALRPHATWVGVAGEL